MQTSARGVVLRDRVEGSTIKTKRQQVCRAGEFLVAEIDAKMGGYGLVPDNLEGAIVSSHYFLYEVDQSRISKSFLNWFSKTPQFFEQVTAKGSTNYAAIRPDAVLGYTIPVPSLDEQNSIARRLDSMQADLMDRLSLLEEVGRDTEAMLQNAFLQIIDGAEYRPLAEVAPLVRREIEINPNEAYTEIGVRSFYKGIFRRRTLAGSEFSWQKLFRINANDLVFSNLMAWEQAIAVAGVEVEGCFGNHRMLTCEVNTQVAAPKFLMYYFQTADGFSKILGSSPGSIARNKTLSSRQLPSIKVPVPSVEPQRRFDELCAYVDEIRAIRASTAKEAEALIPAMLHEIFERKAAAPVPVVAQTENVIALPQAQTVSVDTPFKEAVLVGAMIKAFHEEGGQPLGNFRLQKAVYFARRFMGERALDQQYLRKAAGPYNPSMRYSGGMKIALEKNWIAAATGKFGPGHSPGSAFDDASAWIEKYQFAKPAAWVREKFKFKQNDIWEILATVDYAMLALDHGGKAPNAANVFAYISNDEEWRPKVEKLRLSEASIQNALVELQSLFDDVP
ncbi:restriction endonuclease subunit S [Rhodopseudomonas sp. P2A-2r]|uniref:restriction endonuclease subunit S n=1 Tax=Rhodopseudomonas sp. P2A-2r TaxID=2991972 RepID=UPI0022341186|nr:restriction endonuclease subunit S [Rhodopseudomonas sp. P2A-2r]UZE49798.1 restriction endonuclease subunit S [Rhodopseudomonas sp. P2A-2r]